MSHHTTTNPRHYDSNGTHNKDNDDNNDVGVVENNMALLDQLCQQWTVTVSELSRDAVALRQVSGLVQQVEKGKDSKEKAFSRLQELDALVTSLEEKAELLEEVSREEVRAIQEMEAVSKEADRQHAILVSILSSLDMAVSEKENATTTAPPTMTPASNKKPSSLSRVPGSWPSATTSITSATATTTKKGVVTRVTEAAKPSERGERRFGVLPKAKAAVDASTSTSTLRTTSQPQHHPQPPPPITTTPAATSTPTTIVVPPVSEADLKSIPRTTRGRISLAVINEALADVQMLARRKAARIEEDRRKKHLRLKTSSSSISSGVGGGGGEGGCYTEDPLVLTEQEMRQSCRFFRSGEATARSLLLILCAVSRLKQVPGKNGQVYYHIHTFISETTTNSS